MVEAAKKYNKKLVIGYILRVHPSWKKFIEIAQGLGKPLVMRMNLNQQSSGKTWHTHMTDSGKHVTHRGLRRALCRCNVPDDQIETCICQCHRSEAVRSD